VEVDINQLTLPEWVDQPIKGLTMYTDGILCTRVPSCGYICRSKDTMRKHWYAKHGWSPYGHYQGRQQSRHYAIAQAAIQNTSQAVSCQRFFTTKFGSHYIHIRRPGPSYEPRPPPAHPTVVRRRRHRIPPPVVQEQPSGPPKVPMESPIVQPQARRPRHASNAFRGAGGVSIIDEDPPSDLWRIKDTVGLPGYLSSDRHQ
jgi:hypothetical protein